MRLLAPRLRISRRKVTALVVGLVTMRACWWFLPPEPRVTISVPDLNNHWITYSPNLRYMAVTTEADHANIKTYSSKITLWDMETACILCSFPRQNDPLSDYTQAFSKDEATFVEFSAGQAHFRDVLTGSI